MQDLLIFEERKEYFFTPFTLATLGYMVERVMVFSGLNYN
jgi:hypothetical protein